MKPRTILQSITTAAKTFPAIVLTGPRQSGKTTLLKTAFSETHAYLSLENTDVRLRAKEDPAGFIDQIKGPVILDEIQYVPELLPYIKTAIDNHRAPGQWFLTGSQNFTLMQNVSESLAGRTAVFSLLPFSISELMNNGGHADTMEDFVVKKKSAQTLKSFSLTETMLRGLYPEISSNPKIDRSLWCGSYITTYLERDIRNLKQVGDLHQYEIFLRACAARTGQILDLSSIAHDIGVSFTTAKRWLSLLETGYQVFLLYPYYKNIHKRLVKRPKIYFTDPGLASYLLGINSPETLMNGPFLGPLFETLVVTDFWKRFLHHGQQVPMYYLRTEDKLEIDLVIELENKLQLMEIKSSATIQPEHTKALIKIKRDLGDLIGETMIISNTKDVFTLPHGIKNIPISYLTN